MNKLEKFLTKSFQNVRSSKRTDKLHEAVLDFVLDSYPEWKKYDWVHESMLKEDGFGGTFKMDLVAFDGKDLKICILVKAMNSSVNKNIKNFANTTIGESARIMFSPISNSIEKILFISVHPRIAPRFNNNGEVVGFDDVLSAKSRTKLDNVVLLQYDGKVEVIDLYYDIDNIYNKRSKNDFDFIDIKNLDKLKLFNK